LPSGWNYRVEDTDFSVSYGDYFTAVQSFLEENNHQILREAVSLQSRKNISPDQPLSKNVYLEKHGALYHPSRIELIFREETIQFVLNVAVSASGRKIIDQEYAALTRLCKDLHCPYIPAVYGKGSGRAGQGSYPMFLGQWLEGFHEFHLSETSPGKREIVVWDMVSGNRYLSDKQAKQLYRKAAFILTSCYHPITFEHIFPWHHAAGDFVVGLQDNLLDLRLITVRGYSSLRADNVDINLQSILETMLVFFLTLSIRMRIDRLDGVKELAWADDFSVQETLNGFFEALETMPEETTRGIPLAECFEYYLFSMEEKNLLSVAEEIVDHYHTQVIERKIIQENIEAHIACIKQGLINRHL